MAEGIGALVVRLLSSAVRGLSLRATGLAIKR
jgi:hypothetical protein